VSIQSFSKLNKGKVGAENFTFATPDPEFYNMNSFKFTAQIKWVKNDI
jgi:hypothetical protein